MLLNPYRFGSGVIVPPDLADIIALYSGSKTGGLYDCTDPANLWDDAARTIPASLNGTVRGITDLSGNGLHLSNTATTFTMKNDGTRYYLDCPGTSFLQAFTSPDAVLGSLAGNFHALCFRAVDYNAYMIAFAADRSGQYVSAGVAIADVGSGNEGSITTNFHSSSFSIAESGSHSAGLDVVIAIRETAVDAIIRRDGAQTASMTAGGISAVRTAAPLTLGAGFSNANNNYFNPYKGRVYCAMFLSDAPSDAEVEMVEAYFTDKASL